MRVCVDTIMQCSRDDGGALPDPPKFELYPNQYVLVARDPFIVVVVVAPSDDGSLLQI